MDNPGDNIGKPPAFIVEASKKAKRPDGTTPPISPNAGGDFPFGAATPAGASGQQETAMKPGEDFPLPGVNFPA